MSLSATYFIPVYYGTKDISDSIILYDFMTILTY